MFWCNFNYHLQPLCAVTLYVGAVSHDLLQLFTANAIKPSQVKSQYFIIAPVEHTDTDTSSLIFLQVVSHLSQCNAAGGTLGCVLLPDNRDLCLQTANSKSYLS